MDERDVKAHAESAIKTINKGPSFNEMYSEEVWNHMLKQFRYWNEREHGRILEVLEELRLQGETNGLSLLNLDSEMQWRFIRKTPNGGKTIRLTAPLEGDNVRLSYLYWNNTTVTSGRKILSEFGTLENLVKEFLNDEI